MRLPDLRWLPILPVLAAVSIAGCAQETPGEAAPAGEVSMLPADPTGMPRPSAGTSSPSPADGPLAGISPCELISEQDRASLGLTSRPKEDTLAYSRACEFNDREADILVAVDIYDKLGPDKEVGGAKDRRPVPQIGRHSAERWMFGDLCTFSLAVGGTSTVDATAGDIDGNVQRSCDTALKLAQLVEPKLP